MKIFYQKMKCVQNAVKKYNIKKYQHIVNINNIA